MEPRKKPTEIQLSLNKVASQHRSLGDRRRSAWTHWRVSELLDGSTDVSLMGRAGM
jgi:hypothetical protein